MIDLAELRQDPDTVRRSQTARGESPMIENRQTERKAHGPDARTALNQRAKRTAFPAIVSSQLNGWQHRRTGDSDLGVRGNQCLLGKPNVRSSLDKL